MNFPFIIKHCNEYSNSLGLILNHPVFWYFKNFKMMRNNIVHTN